MELTHSTVQPLKPTLWLSSITSQVTGICNMLHHHATAGQTCSTLQNTQQYLPPPLVKGLLKSTQSASFEPTPLQAFQLTATEQLQYKSDGEGKLLSQIHHLTVTLAMALNTRFTRLKFLSPEEVLHVQTKVQTMALAEKRRWMSSSMAVPQHLYRIGISRHPAGFAPQF